MAKKPTRKTPIKQQDGRAAIVDNPGKSEMTTVGPRRISRKIVEMPVEPKPSKAQRNVMDPVPKKRPKAVKPGKLGDQVEHRVTDRDIADTGYVALRLHVVDGDLQVRSAKFVEGPLATDEFVSAGLTYEVKAGRRRIAHGDVPDSIEWRSHPDPEGRPGMEGHHVVEQETFDFTVRIPAEEAADLDLDSLQVNLYRWRGAGPGEHIKIDELTNQPKSAIKLLASVRGLAVNELPKALQRDVLTALRRPQA